jgi:hypothetical protein
VKQDTIDRLNYACGLLQGIAGAIREDGDKALATGDHIQIIKHYDKLRLANALIKESREALAQMEERLSREDIPNTLREHGIKTITIEGVGRVTVSHRFGCSMLDKDAGLEWLRENGHGGLIIETVNSSSLAAFAKSLLQEQGEDLPSEIFKVSTNPYTSVTKAGVL